MLTITPNDFRKLSESCQRELIGLLGYMGVNEGVSDDESIPYEDSFLRLDNDDSYLPIPDSQETSPRSKCVIDITPEQAKELIANISGKSIETLRCFVSGEPVPLGDLIGKNKSYSNLSDLKRSFVGAVNRRLRTVTGYRQAVLFLTVKSDNPQIETKISVRQVTATSLRLALGLVIPSVSE